MTVMVYFECDETALGSVMSALSSELPNVSALRIETQAKGPRTKNRTRGGGRARPRKIDMVILGIMNDGKEHGYDELAQALSAAGFSPTSVSPSLSMLCREGVLERVGPFSNKTVRRAATPLELVEKANPGITG